MSRVQISSDLRESRFVVGTVHSREALAAAQKLSPGQVDLLEIRLDHFAPDLAPLRRALPRLETPLIITARHPAEGGQNRLGVAQRRELYREFLPHARFLDLELRSVKALAAVLVEARAGGVKIILSHHDFRATPSLARLRVLARRLHAAGADVGKIATWAATPQALGALLALFAPAPARPMSVMAMGRFGKVSRLLLADAGSVLNYGYLASPNASGQWEATLLQKRLAELRAA